MTMSLSGWSEQLLNTQAAAGSDSFFPTLNNLIAQVCQFDEILVVHFSSQTTTKMLFQMPVNHDDHLDLYLSKLFVLDPFYVSSKKGNEGLFLLEQLHQGFGEDFDDYYRQYFRHLNFADELGYLIQLPDNNSCIHIELAKFNDSSKFKDVEIDALKDVFDIIKMLVINHQQKLAPAAFEFETSYVEDFHQLFGTEILTPREHDVSLLMMQGYSVKSIAGHLSVGDETVKMHRKNIYAKLEVSSQPELMALFIDLLVLAEPPVVVDPLVAYLKRKHSS